MMIGEYGTVGGMKLAKKTGEPGENLLQYHVAHLLYSL
jgi:hypothetical protein